MKYYQKNGIVGTVILFTLLTVNFAMVSMFNGSKGSTIGEDIFFSMIASFIMVLPPLVTFLKSIILMDKENFVIVTLLGPKNYSKRDIQKILRGKGFFTKNQMHIYLNDKSKIWVSDMFWTKKFFDDLDKYFENIDTKTN